MSTPAAAPRALRRDARARREIMTPEGVPLTVELAEFSERAIALIIDLAIMLLAVVVMVVIALYVSFQGSTGAVVLAAGLLFMFFLRNLYFIHFELSGRGATPGKRIVGIRVTDRSGGPLKASAVIARNLTRELEVFIPLGLLVSLPAGNSMSGIQWGSLLIIGWVLAFLVLMFFNRNRMRAGDLIAGTIVIALPRQRLLRDLVETRARFAFEDRHLRAYGAHELQVLEDLLHRAEIGDTPEVLREVASRICRKIDWTEPVPPAEATLFLRDFYTAQRAFLEREQLFGRRLADKHEAAGKRNRL